MAHERGPIMRNVFPCHDIVWSNSSIYCGPATDLIHKSINARVPYPTMRHIEQKCAHFCSEWCIVGCGTDALWDM